jgi:hypothetical protein
MGPPSGERVTVRPYDAGPRGGFLLAANSPDLARNRSMGHRRLGLVRAVEAGPALPIEQLAPSRRCRSETDGGRLKHLTPLDLAAPTAAAAPGAFRGACVQGNHAPRSTTLAARRALRGVFDGLGSPSERDVRVQSVVRRYGGRATGAFCCERSTSLSTPVWGRRDRPWLRSSGSPVACTTSFATPPRRLRTPTSSS